MRFIFIFIDGIGIGKKDENNPFFFANPAILRLWQDSDQNNTGITLKAIDPLLGIDGIPQSATGQTTLFTGINIPELIGKHFGSFPNKALRKVIKEENLLFKLSNSGKKVKFVNSYPKHSELFSNSHINIDEEGNLIFSDDFPDKFKKRISVTSSILISNNIKPFDIEDIKKKRSLYQDYSNKSLLKYGLDLPVFSPEEAAGVLYNTSGNYDLILYEFFQSDIYGHRNSFNEQVELISDLDSLLNTLISLLNNEEDTLLITSDHGNLEDGTRKSHTLNPVPLILWGRGNKILSENIDNLSDITPEILSFLTSLSN